MNRDLIRRAALAVLEPGAAAPPGGPPAIRRLKFVPASEVTMESVAYLWQDRIPLGKLTCIEGKMGTGKTTLLSAIAAAVTTGSALPGQASTPPGNVLLVSLEDGKGDTLVPRLAAAGADLRRCHLFDGYTFGGATEGGMFSIGEDVERLRWVIEELGIVWLGIDPLTAAIDSGVNSYKDQDMRRILAPLARLAEDTRTGISFVRHFRKGGGAAEDAGGGSVGIGAACRSVLRVDCDPENPERYLVSSVKSSTSKKPPTIGYRIDGVTLPGPTPIETSRIAWDGESAWTADSLASHAMSAEDRPLADEAQDWLRDALGNGQPRLAKELFKAADADGIPRRTLQRAADVLGVLKERRGFGEGSNWSLPASIRAKEPPFVTSKNMARMGTNGMNDGDGAGAEPLREVLI